MAITILGAMALCAVSCSTPRPRVDDVLEASELFSGSGGSVLPDKWWSSFGDDELSRLIEEALRSNFSLQSAWARLTQAQATARRQGADLWPSLDLQASAARKRESVKVEGGGSDTTDSGTYTAGLSASYELDLWGRIRSTKDAAVLDASATEQQLRASAITLSSQVASTWYQLVAQNGLIDLLNEQLKLNKDVLELVTLRFRRGQTGATDVLQQQRLVESRKGDIASAEAQAAVLKHALAILLGRPPADNVAERQSDLTELPPLPATGLPADLVRRRPDILEAYYSLLASDERAASAVADRFPRISITAQASTSSESVSDLFDNWLASLAGNLVAPLIDAGSRRAEADRTEAVVTEKLYAYGQVVLTAIGEVEDALVRESRQKDLLASLEKQMELSEQVIDRNR
ncbi:MAG: efflux transporter outer membrane subunit, partial [Verrucomicrobia bacterium]|nr:efflux transporter outer membrane subunit [Verrucomicrobiota bacterium]